MFHTNMKVSRMPMSAWNLIGENAHVMTPAASVMPTSATTLPVNCTALLIGLGQRHALALLRELHREEVERVVDADADAECDHGSVATLTPDARAIPSALRTGST
jgi:hypothetical protein